MKYLKSILFLTSVFLLISPYNINAKDDILVAQGLNLEKVYVKTKRERVSIPNPHLALDCFDCHKKGGVKLKEKKKRRIRSRYSSKVGGLIDDLIKLCNSCHEGENLHPVDVNPMKSSLKIHPPNFLPLGKGKKHKNKILCTTCHDIHAKESAFKLLRGFPGTKEAGYARFKERQDFCKACHGDNLIKRSPHKGDERSCRFCHVSDPRKVDKPRDTVRLDIVKRCNFCHAKLEEAHFLAVNAFADKTLQDEIPNIDVPFIGGQITCVTCHDQHWKSDLPHKLRPNYVAFAERSVRINPHWTGTFCLACHDKPPKKGEPVSFLFDGDFVQVCNRCHETEEAAADIHPVDFEVPDYILETMPADFKLSEGNVITCVTCHDLTYQTTINNPMRDKNPKFLRGGPYLDRSDICYECHQRETYERMSPHNQLDENGEIMEEKCLFCHSSRPDVEVVGIDKVKFTGNPAEYCYGCHQGKEEGHPVGTTHNGVEPTEDRIKCIKKTEKKFKALMPLFDDKVFCGTCHNPHQKGVLKGAAARGAGAASRLRFSAGYQICVACHCDKGGM